MGTMQINKPTHSERLAISVTLIAKSQIGAAPIFSVAFSVTLTINPTLTVNELLAVVIFLYLFRRVKVVPSLSVMG